MKTKGTKQMSRSTEDKKKKMNKANTKKREVKKMRRDH